MKPDIILTLTLLSTFAFAGESGKKEVVPAEEDGWKFSLSMPGWAPGITGETGLHGVNTHADVNPSDLLRHADMLASFRGEASKGRFGVTADFLYLSLSDGIGTDSVVKKIDVQLDQILGELGVRWRVIEGPHGWVDVTAGVRYTNLYQKVVAQTDAGQLEGFSGDVVEAVSDGLRRALAASDIDEIIAVSLSADATVADPRGNPVPIAHLRSRDRDRHRILIREIIEKRRAELTAAVQAAEQAVGAERVAAQGRVAAIKKDLSEKIADALEKSNSTEVSRTDDWFDPYIGLRARYNFNDRFYFTAKGDVGGFSVGSQFTWQAEAAFGCHLTPNIYAEAGYRALGVDYQQDNLTYDMITHGAQLTVGIEF